MAAPTVPTSNTATASSASSIVVSFPASLAAGDELCIFVAWYDGTNSRTVTTPAGWTSQQSHLNDRTGLVCFTKTASSGDVSAGSVTVSLSGVAAHIRAAVLRITGMVPATPIVGSELDSEASTASASPSYTTALTPATNFSLLVMAFAGSLSTGSAGATTAGSYASTPTVTFTEYAELSAGGAGNENLTLAVAAGPYTGSTQWTNRTMTFSQTHSLERAGIAIMYEGTQDAAGTAALHSASPSFDAASASADTNGTAALHSASPSFPNQSGDVVGETAWVNTDKPSEPTWVNLDK